jgi:hypothetical protein
MWTEMCLGYGDPQSGTYFRPFWFTDTWKFIIHLLFFFIETLGVVRMCFITDRGLMVTRYRGGAVEMHLAVLMVLKCGSLYTAAYSIDAQMVGCDVELDD